MKAPDITNPIGPMRPPLLSRVGTMLAKRLFGLSETRVCEAWGSQACLLDEEVSMLSCGLLFAESDWLCSTCGWIGADQRVVGWPSDS